jgi:hypothetical protein
MAVAASRKGRQMPALQARIEISQDRRTHRVVLPALAEADSVT